LIDSYEVSEKLSVFTMCLLQALAGCHSLNFAAYCVPLLLF